MNNPITRKLVETLDGSYTFEIPSLKECYHSRHGAIREAKHVYLQQGLQYCIAKGKTTIDLLELGFGTGLNAFLTLLHCQKEKIKVHYIALEAFPLSYEDALQVNYAEQIPADLRLFQKIHQVPWNKAVAVTSFFTITKIKQQFEFFEAKHAFDLIYFDAFGPRVQPELWTEMMFQRMHTALRNSGVLVTYSAKGSVRRAMQAVGFTAEKLQGPPGKREMLRAAK